MKFHQTKLANGLSVIAELNPVVHSVAIGFFVRTGSRDETAAIAGVSHFLEHMVFKGSEKYSADDVNRIFDEDGFEASTLEYASVYAKVSGSAVEMTKQLLYSIDARSIAEAIEKGVVTNAKARMTEDCQQGIAKFLEK